MALEQTQPSEYDIQFASHSLLWSPLDVFPTKLELIIITSLSWESFPSHCSNSSMNIFKYKTAMFIIES